MQSKEMEGKQNINGLIISVIILKYNWSRKGILSVHWRVVKSALKCKPNNNVTIWVELFLNTISLSLASFVFRKNWYTFVIIIELYLVALE